MDYLYRSNIFGEAAQRLREVAKFLDASGCSDSSHDVSTLADSFLAGATEEKERVAKGAGLYWAEARITAETRFAFGNRYLGWAAATRLALPGWRLPTVAELQQLYKENPGSVVFNVNGRYSSGQAYGVGTTTAIWTSQDDSRDFAIEATVTQEFGLTTHPALKTNSNTVWYVKEL